MPFFPSRACRSKPSNDFAQEAASASGATAMFPPRPAPPAPSAFFLPLRQPAQSACHSDCGCPRVRAGRPAFPQSRHRARRGHASRRRHRHPCWLRQPHRRDEPRGHRRVKMSCRRAPYRPPRFEKLRQLRDTKRTTRLPVPVGKSPVKPTQPSALRSPTLRSRSRGGRDPRRWFLPSRSHSRNGFKAAILRRLIARSSCERMMQRQKTATELSIEIWSARGIPP